jgi:peptide subunit release factor 1 (eRF1)
VAPLTAETVRRLAAYRGVRGPVVSLYLDVDGRRYIRPRDYETQLESMLRRAAASKQVDEDLRRIDGRVRAGIERSRTRGVALFSCAAETFFEMVELTARVRNQVAVNQSPHVRQLEAILERSRPYGVLLVDRQRARMLVLQAGQLSDRSELFDQLPRHDDDRGDWDRDHVRDHAAALVQQHARRAAQVAFAAHQQRPLDHLILAGPDAAVREVERELHSYLRDRIVARLRLSVSVTDDEIRTAALAVEGDVERVRTEELVNRLRDAIGTSGAGLLGLPPRLAAAAPIGAGGGSGIAGLEGVLKALFDHRVETLLVSEDYATPGWHCRTCDYLAGRGPNCPLCPTSMDRVDDVVEEAIESALAQSCRVALCDGSADLDVMGRIGALLRF